MSSNKSNKSIKRQLVGSAAFGLTLAAVTTGVFLFGASNYASGGERVAMEQCESDILATDLDCEAIKSQVEDLLVSFGNEKNFPLYITPSFETFCGEATLGCVQSFYNVSDNIPPIMSISYGAAAYGNKLPDIVAHEYVHVLTNNEETEWAKTAPALADPKVDPLEIIADCGISYLLKIENPSYSYMSECTPEQEEISRKVIEDIPLD